MVLGWGYDKDDDEADLEPIWRFSEFVGYGQYVLELKIHSMGSITYERATVIPELQYKHAPAHWLLSISTTQSPSRSAYLLSFHPLLISQVKYLPPSILPSAPLHMPLRLEDHAVEDGKDASDGLEHCDLDGGHLAVVSEEEACLGETAKYRNQEWV